MRRLIKSGGCKQTRLKNKVEQLLLVPGLGFKDVAVGNVGIGKKGVTGVVDAVGKVMQIPGTTNMWEITQ